MGSKEEPDIAECKWCNAILKKYPSKGWATFDGDRYCGASRVMLKEHIPRDVGYLIQGQMGRNK